MKTNKFFLTSMGFLAGLAFGVSMISMMAFTSGSAPQASGSGIVPVTATEARGYAVKYLADAAPINKVIKGFTIDKSQLEAMNTIARENTDLAGFRIYMGVDNNLKKIGIVVGVDATGKDAIKNTIFNTDSKILSPCPPVCDASSPISPN